jgi:hypothetical protein
LSFSVYGYLEKRVSIWYWEKRFLFFFGFCVLDEDFDLMIDSEIWVLFKFVLKCESFEILQFELGF